MAMGMHENIRSDGIGIIGITFNGHPLAILDGLSRAVCMASHVPDLFPDLLNGHFWEWTVRLNCHAHPLFQ